MSRGSLSLCIVYGGRIRNLCWSNFLISSFYWLFIKGCFNPGSFCSYICWGEYYVLPTTLFGHARDTPPLLRLPRLNDHLKHFKVIRKTNQDRRSDIFQVHRMEVIGK